MADRKPIAFFSFSPEELEDDNLDATAERVAKAIAERAPLLEVSARELGRGDQNGR